MPTSIMINATLFHENMDGLHVISRLKDLIVSLSGHLNNKAQPVTFHTTINLLILRVQHQFLLHAFWKIQGAIVNIWINYNYFFAFN